MKKEINFTELRPFMYKLIHNNVSLSNGIFTVPNHGFNNESDYLFALRGNSDNIQAECMVVYVIDENTFKAVSAGDTQISDLNGELRIFKENSLEETNLWLKQNGY